MELRYFRVATRCRVNTELEEQTSNLELQAQHCTQMIAENPNRTESKDMGRNIKCFDYSIIEIYGKIFYHKRAKVNQFWQFFKESKPCR